ncbi:MAG TPA: transglutaminase-like domain-containing protein [Candidatus Limnocylindrales bacterium]
MGVEVRDYTRQSAYSDPGKYAALLDDLPRDIGALTAVVRNVIVHYVAGGFEFTGDRLAEIDCKFVERILDTDQGRHPFPLAEPRRPDQRVAGCCRDFTLLTVAALRHQGVPARSRAGWASYLQPDFHYDHVIAEYWNGERWVWVDAQVGELDIPPDAGLFDSGATAWRALRRGEIDPDNYGVWPGSPLRGDWFIRNYVIHEVAHRYRDELLLWEEWGAIAHSSHDLAGDLAFFDDVAELLVRADGGDESAERELHRVYTTDDRLRPGEAVRSFSPAHVG